MIFIIVIAMVIVLTAFYFSPVQQSTQYVRQDASIAAQQMIYYHSGTSKICTKVGDCADGEVDPTPMLSTLRQGKGALAYHDGDFTSGSHGIWIYTYYRYPGPAGLRDEVDARVTAALIDTMKGDVQAWAGEYDAGTGGLILGRSQSPWKDPVTGEVSLATPVEVDLSGTDIPDKAPIMVTRIGVPPPSNP